AMSISRYETRLGQLLLHAPALLRAGTYAVLAFELLGPAVGRPWRKPRGGTPGGGAFLVPPLGGARRRRRAAGPAPAAGGVGWVALLPGSIWPTEEARPEVPSPRRGPAAWVLVGVLLAVVVLFNATYLWPRPGGIRLGAVQTVARVLGLQQYWSVFSPPGGVVGADSDGWLTITGDRADNRSVDLLAGGGTPRTGRPPLGADVYPNRRWRHWAAAVKEEWPRGTVQRRTIEEGR